jgi:hypothetical protein
MEAVADIESRVNEQSTIQVRTFPHGKKMQKEEKQFKMP